jgi:ribosomal protein L40E
MYGCEIYVQQLGYGAVQRVRKLGVNIDISSAREGLPGQILFVNISFRWYIVLSKNLPCLICRRCKTRNVSLSDVCRFPVKTHK